MGFFGKAQKQAIAFRPSAPPPAQSAKPMPVKEVKIDRSDDKFNQLNKNPTNYPIGPGNPAWNPPVITTLPSDRRPISDPRVGASSMPIDREIGRAHV